MYKQPLYNNPNKTETYFRKYPLNGHQKTYKKQPETNKNVPINQVDYIIKKKNLSKQPNTKRTLEPSLNEEKSRNNDKKNKSRSLNRLCNIKNKSVGLSTEYTNPLINYEAPKENIQTRNSKTFKSFKFTDNTKEELKRHNKTTVYDVYGTTSQIYSLPGCVKRDIPERVKKNKCNEDSINLKYNCVFSSNVSCLPGTMTHKVDKNFSDMSYHVRTYKDKFISQETFYDKFYPTTKSYIGFRKGKKFDYGLGAHHESDENVMKIQHDFEKEYDKKNLFSYYNRNRINTQNNQPRYPKKIIQNTINTCSNNNNFYLGGNESKQEVKTGKKINKNNDFLKTHFIIG